MSSNDAGMETALLEIAKDLLQASDDLVATDPSASAKLAHEAYEIGRDLGIVRNHLEEMPETVDFSPATSAISHQQNGHHATAPGRNGSDRQPRDIEDDADADLFRILDRQKAILPTPMDLAPARKPSRGTKQVTFEAQAARRSSGWFGWMRPREWRHAG